MNSSIPTLIISLLSSLSVFGAAYGDKELADDIEKLAGLFAPKERSYVTNYLRHGPSGLTKVGRAGTGATPGDFLTAAMARNSLNGVALEQDVAGPLSRTMWRHAQGTNFPDDTRGYAFSSLTRLAGRDQEVDVLARSLAKEIVQRDQDSLKRAAQRFLGEGDPASIRPARTFTANQLVGRWRHADSVRQLATHLHFKEDGTYTGNVEVAGKANGAFSGRWTLKDAKLNYEYTASSDPTIPAGSKDQDKVIELTTDRYTIENTLGLRETFFRVK